MKIAKFGFLSILPVRVYSERSWHGTINIVRCAIVQGAAKIRDARIEQSFCVGLVWLCLTFRLLAQTSDSFNPEANGVVRALAFQADGKILIGGDFTSLGGQAHNYLGRLNADGSVDTSFTPNPSGAVNTVNTVNAVAVQPDGKIVIGGTFTKIGATTRNRIARLNADGTLDATFNPNANNTVYSLALQTDGQILVGGSFSTLGGSNVMSLGRINSNGLVDTNFVSPQASGSVYAIAIQTNGHIVMGGPFTINVGGAARSGLARLNAEGNLDTNYASCQGNWVNALALQPNGQILVGGNFTSIANQSCYGLGRLNTDGTLDATFTNRTDGPVNSVLVQPDGKILVGGSFYTLGNLTRKYLGRLNADGSADATFDPGANNYVNQSINAMLATGDGRIIVGGGFIFIGGQPRNYLARLETDGSAPFCFNPNPNGALYGLATQPDGKLLVGGAFSSLAGQTRKALGRMNTDGSLDLTFTPVVSGSFGLGNGGNQVYCLAVQTNGQILVGGWFTNLAGGFRYSLGRINADGALDPDLNIALGGYYPYARCLLVQTNGQILVGGNFSSIGGQARTGLARLNVNGTLDASFNPNLVDIYGGTGYTFSLALQPDGKILVGGQFNTVNGQTRNNIVRLNANGTSDNTFSETSNYGYGYAANCLIRQPNGQILVSGNIGTINGQAIGRLNADGTVDTNFTATSDGLVSVMSLQTDGKIVVGGNFAKLNGATNYCLGRFNSDGTLDTNFGAGIPAPFTPTYASVSALALQPDGAIIVGGSFSSLGGQSRTNLGRLNNATPGTQSLSLDGGTVTWLRGGGSPEVWRTTFESSNDGISWTNLGVGTRTDGGWQLTGLSVSTNDLIRARGFTSGGQYGGSGSIVESLQAPLSILVNDGNFGFSANRFGFNIRGTTGKSVIWDASTNLVDWTVLGTNVPGSTPIYLRDAGSTNLPQRFYRVRYQ